jgi:hypothetical protein
MLPRFDRSGFQGDKFRQGSGIVQGLAGLYQFVLLESIGRKDCDSQVFECHDHHSFLGP